MNEYRDWLYKNNYADKCVENYVRGATIFAETGKPMTMDAVREWAKEERKVPMPYVLGAMHYIQYKTTGICTKYKTVDKSKMRGAPIKCKELIPFRQWLLDGGFTKHTVSGYVNGVYTYLRSGGEVDDETLEEYCNNIVGKTNYRNIRSGLRKYSQFLNGLDSSRRPHRAEAPKTCNKDCFNCIYDDCIMN